MNNEIKNTVFGSYKEFVIIERESLRELEEKGKAILAEGQDEHDKFQIQKGKTILECVEWMKQWNIYNNEFKIKG
jgi:hypothetical protein